MLQKYDQHKQVQQLNNKSGEYLKLEIALLTKLLFKHAVKRKSYN